MKLVLGVKDIAYADPDVKGATTTYQVAQVLESEYDVMGTFYDAHREDIESAMVNGLQKSLQDAADGLPIHGAPLVGAMGQIEHEFRSYLDNDEWQRITGRRIAAAQMGVSHRMKKKKGNSRPAFIDTGLYQSSFRAWIKR